MRLMAVAKKIAAAGLTCLSFFAIFPLFHYSMIEVKNRFLGNIMSFFRVS